MLVQFTNVFNKLQCWKTIWKFSQHTAGVVVAIFPIRYSSTNKKALQLKDTLRIKIF